MKNKSARTVIIFASLVVLAIGLLVLIFHKSEKQIIEEIRALARTDSAQFRNVADYMYAIRDTLNKKDNGCNEISVFSNQHAMYLRTQEHYLKLNGFDRYDFLASRSILYVSQCDFYIKFQLSHYGDSETQYYIYQSAIPLTKEIFPTADFFEKVGDNLYIVVKKTSAKN